MLIESELVKIIAARARVQHFVFDCDSRCCLDLAWTIFDSIVDGHAARADVGRDGSRRYSSCVCCVPVDNPAAVANPIVPCGLQLAQSRILIVFVGCRDPIIVLHSTLEELDKASWSTLSNQKASQTVALSVEWQHLRRIIFECKERCKGDALSLAEKLNQHIVMLAAFAEMFDCRARTFVGPTWNGFAEGSKVAGHDGVGYFMRQNAVKNTFFRA